MAFDIVQRTRPIPDDIVLDIEGYLRIIRDMHLESRTYVLEDGLLENEMPLVMGELRALYDQSKAG